MFHKKKVKCLGSFYFVMDDKQNEEKGVITDGDRSVYQSLFVRNLFVRSSFGKITQLILDQRFLTCNLGLFE